MERNGEGGGKREKRPFVLLFSSQFRQSPRYDVEFTTHRDISAARDPRLLSNLVFERISSPSAMDKRAKLWRRRETIGHRVMMINRLFDRGMR